MKRFNVPLFRTVIKKPLQIQGVLLLHVHLRDLKVPVLFGAANEFDVSILVETVFMDRFLPGIFFFKPEKTLTISRPVYMSEIRCKSGKSTSAIVRVTSML